MQMLWAEMKHFLENVKLVQATDTQCVGEKGELLMVEIPTLDGVEIVCHIVNTLQPTTQLL